MRDLVRQLLTESEDALAGWRERILKAVGDNGQLMIDIIGELELIIGPQPAVAESPPMEAEQRFHRIFLRFIQVFCKPNHPLVIFLDDLQWADSASMRLIDLLSSQESGTGHLLLIGAYRDNEVQAGHPVALWRKDLRDRDMSLEELHLQPLHLDHLIQLLADTLGTDEREVEALAVIVSQKTAWMSDFHGPKPCWTRSTSTLYRSLHLWHAVSRPKRSMSPKQFSPNWDTVIRPDQNLGMSS